MIIAIVAFFIWLVLGADYLMDKYYKPKQKVTISDNKIEAIIEVCEEHIELEGIRDPSGNAVTYINNDVKEELRKVLEEL